MYAWLKYLLGRAIEFVMRRWIMKHMYILCAWAGYDLATMAARGRTPTKEQMVAALHAQAYLLSRRYHMLTSDKTPDEARAQKLAELLTDEREFLAVIKALWWATLIGRLKAEYKRRKR
ncbi:hypothetical protein FJY93_02710 [Candidatus Kaiserbacteria bacterium]|nr:hypothetical protein [Candidatus Kaiserbacteria bacterium]